ncbi:TPA: hypothetical protein ACK0YD_002665, partial [Staphylococcus aureus]
MRMVQKRLALCQIGLMRSISEVRQ